MENKSTPFSLYRHLFNDTIYGGVSSAIRELFRTKPLNEAVKVTIAFDTDLDGISAAGLLTSMLRGKLDEGQSLQINKAPVSHGISAENSLRILLENTDQKPDMIFVLDLALTPETLADIEKQDAQVVWIDHHPYQALETSAHSEKLVFLNSCSLGEVECTTSLVSELISRNLPAVPGEVFFIRDLVKTYDTGAFTDEDIKNTTLGKHCVALNAALNEHPILSRDESGKMCLSAHAVGYLQSISNSSLIPNAASENTFDLVFDMIFRGTQIIDFKTNAINSVIKKYVTYRNVEVPITDNEDEQESMVLKMAVVFHSDDMDVLADRILENSDTEKLDVDAVAVCYLKRHGEGIDVKVSLRSRRSNAEVRIDILAKQFGGGGHRSAAGFQIPLSEISKVPFLC